MCTRPCTICWTIDHMIWCLCAIVTFLIIGLTSQLLLCNWSNKIIWERVRRVWNQPTPSAPSTRPKRTGQSPSRPTPSVRPHGFRSPSLRTPFAILDAKSITTQGTKLKREDQGRGSAIARNQILPRISLAPQEARAIISSQKCRKKFRRRRVSSWDSAGMYYYFKT